MIPLLIGAYMKILDRKPEVLILTGLPASGKSTAAREWVAEDPDSRRRLNWDDLRLEMFGPTWKWNRADEAKMKEASFELAHAYLASGLSVVIDNTNLTQAARAKWETLAKAYGITPEVHEISTPIETCIARDRQRGAARVGRAVIERMALFYGFIDWSQVPGRFVIVDVDGTLANLSHRRGHVVPIFHHKEGCLVPDPKHGRCEGCGAKGEKDWAAFFAKAPADTPIKPIFDLVRTLSREYTILVVSGRGTDIGIQTEDWLDQHWPNVGSLPRYRHLFMRQGGDYRPDFQVKGEIADLLPLDRVAYVIDDRDQVVQMWRDRGLTCLQVAKGDF